MNLRFLMRASWRFYAQEQGIVPLVALAEQLQQASINTPQATVVPDKEALKESLALLVGLSQSPDADQDLCDRVLGFLTKWCRTYDCKITPEEWSFSEPMVFQGEVGTETPTFIDGSEAGTLVLRQFGLTAGSGKELESSATSLSAGSAPEGYRDLLAKLETLVGPIMMDSKSFC